MGDVSIACPGLCSAAASLFQGKRSPVGEAHWDEDLDATGCVRACVPAWVRACVR